MTSLTSLFAAVLILAGVGAAAYSLTAQLLTGEHLATLAVAAFAFAGALGIWRAVSVIEKHLRDMRRKSIGE